MTVLVNDNTSFKVAIAVRVGSVPEVHAHATILAVRRSHEVGVVETGAILSIGNDGIVFTTATFKVVLLEITSELSEAVSETR